ncbi:hypothetical protein PAAG_01238 [Paracoccidioides lutzii Pb01]|uniref:Uncharacterized protein n=1 Tax=Paracoccidioides lutzii (strain ATCC MYA-826 / Pb01) TaxID=502779 RepID=C1GRU3_PARBA|nr:hypothetical protein PAAG_01238 [Paracoccidioides lutzii Pb01]EEH38317.2 hypothetical protein PAAG_01238 [Paracoccidioides lutzii Pb01]
MASTLQVLHIRGVRHHEPQISIKKCRNSNGIEMSGILQLRNSVDRTFHSYHYSDSDHQRPSQLTEVIGSQPPKVGDSLAGICYHPSLKVRSLNENLAILLQFGMKDSWAPDGKGGMYRPPFTREGKIGDGDKFCLRHGRDVCARFLLSFLVWQKPSQAKDEEG